MSKDMSAGQWENYDKFLEDSGLEALFTDILSHLTTVINLANIYQFPPETSGDFVGYALVQKSL